VESQQPEVDLAAALSHVARALQSEQSAQATLQKIVELAVATVKGCDHAGITVMDREFTTPAASGPVPRQVDLIQYSTNQGPCLDAIRRHRVFVTDDLQREQRWPLFSARTVAETGVRSMLSFRLFLNKDTLGSLNLYSKERAAFGPDSQAIGEVFASHAALAMSAAHDRERFEEITADLEASESHNHAVARQVDMAVALQRSMLTDLPDLTPLQITARYLPATVAAEIGGDWYDAFWLPTGDVKLTVGDLAGHDLNAAAAMGQARSVLRSLAIDRAEPPGQLLGRFDNVLSFLLPAVTGTCVCATLSRTREGWQAKLGNAGHLPPLLMTADGARYLPLADDLMLGTGVQTHRTTTIVDLLPGSTLLLYTDGLVEQRHRHLDVGLHDLQTAGSELAAAPVDELCDELLRRLAPHPTDDVCLLAVRLPLPDRFPPA
jgi:serine phosphatase RsbU (regulator of sigma subunit)